MKKGLTEMVFILDRSGSMYSLTRDTVGGFNSMLERQRAEEGEALVSVVLFNSQSEVLYDRKDIRAVEQMTEKQYAACGCTALIDALGGAIHHIGNVHKYAREEDRPEHTVFVITTDGLENASRQYTADKVKQMITRQQEKYGWQFIFLGANIDAVETAAHYGIKSSNAVDYCPDAEGTEINFRVMDKAIRSVRECGTLCEDWALEAKADFKKRGKKNSK